MTTFEAVNDTDHLEVFVGDPKQEDFLPRVKFMKWGNEVNFSLGLAELGGSLDVQGDTLTFEQEQRRAKFYQTSEEQVVPATRIRRVLRGEDLNPFEATGEYEMFNHISTPGEVLFAHYVVPEPSICVFDLMSAELHLDVDKAGTAKDFNYRDKSGYHPVDVPIGNYDRVHLLRYYTPVTPFVNPMFMDAGLHNMDVQWHGTDLPASEVIEAQMSAVETVVARYGVETNRHESRGKIYFKHGDRWVKFYSGQPEVGGLYSYVNIDCAYNKAFDFYRPEVDKDEDLRDEFAYGLAQAFPEITHDIMQEIANAFAENLGLGMFDEPYDEEERQIWQDTQMLQMDRDWLIHGRRKDANWFRRRHHDGLELEIELLRRPESRFIHLTANNPKGIRAHWQADKDGRLPDVCRSISVYHVDKKNNEYTTGKIAHIYRPIAWDSAGMSVFCDFAEGEGLDDGDEMDLAEGLTVVIPQWFINEAKYPVVVDPTFGYTTQGGTTALDAGNLIVGQLVTGAAGTVDSLSAYISDALESQSGQICRVKAAIYVDSSGALLKSSTEKTTGENVAGHWGVFTGFSNQAVSAISYWIVIWSEAIAGQYTNARWLMNYDANSGKHGKTKSVTYVAGAGGWPDPLTSVTDTATVEYSIYITYTATVGPSGLKTAQGTAKASIKTFNEVAIASVKSMAGIT